MERSKTLSTLRITALVSFSVTCNFGWAAFFTLSTPLFSTLGLSSVLSSLANASGPVSGFIQIPLGVWSDRLNSRFGRRKPFLIVGTIMSVIGMIFFANAQTISKDNSTSIIIAILALWLFNIGLNFVQAVGMALMLDMCPTTEALDKASSIQSAQSGFAYCLANFLGFVNFVAVFTFFTANYQAVFYLGMIIVIAFIIPTIVAGWHEAPLPKVTAKVSVLNVIKEMLYEVRIMSRATLIILVMYFISSLAQFPWQLYFTDYVGKDIYNGDATAPDGSLKRELYNEGVRAGSLANGIMGLTTFLCSLILPFTMDLIGLKATYFIGHVWGFVSMIITLWPKMDTVMAVYLISGAWGIFNCVVNTVPWALIGRSVDDSKSGLYAGILNTVQVIAQLIAGPIAGAMVDNMAGLGLGEMAPGVASGGIFAFVGLLIIPFIIIPRKPIIIADQDSSVTPLIINNEGSHFNM